MEFNFIKYLYTTIPGITRSELSELKSKYISKAFQGKVSLELGLDKWVRIRVEKNTHIFEDLLESFFGGLDVVGDMVFKFGAGGGLSYNMILKIFENVKIDRSLGKKGIPKTQMKELFEKLHWGFPVESFQEGPNRTVIATISFTQDAIRSLREFGANVNTPTLAVESGRDKKLAFKNAYRIALEKIRKIGITDKWVEQYRGNRDLTNPELTPYIQTVQNRLKEEGYVGFHFKKAQTTKEGKYIQLIGTKPNKELVILSTTGPAETELEGKRQVLENYASGR